MRISDWSSDVCSSDLTAPNSEPDGCTLGMRAGGMSSICSSSASHSLLWTLNSMVREALLTSLTCLSPWVSCHISQLSIVPKASSPLARSEEHMSELQSLMRISYAVF